MISLVSGITPPSTRGRTSSFKTFLKLSKKGRQANSEPAARRPRVTIPVPHRATRSLRSSLRVEGSSRAAVPDTSPLASACPDRFDPARSNAIKMAPPATAAKVGKSQELVAKSVPSPTAVTPNISAPDQPSPQSQLKAAPILDVRVAPATLSAGLLNGPAKA